MITLTNKYDYPPCVVEMAWAGLRRPTESEIHVTQLIAPPAIRYYQLRRWDDLVLDVDDFIYSGFGTAWHQYLGGFVSKSPGMTWYGEQTLQMSAGTQIITGTLDIRSADGEIEDHKVTSAWAFVFGKPEWEQQLNVYALLCRAADIPVKSLTINAFLRDWSQKNVYLYSPQYPPRPFIRFPIPLWSVDKAKKFVQERIDDHNSGLRPCTPEERWQRDTTYAVVRQGIKKARRVFDTAEEAAAWTAEQKDKSTLSTVVRAGACRRCDEYCPVRSVCEIRDTYADHKDN